jgi:hypothetical protein
MRDFKVLRNETGVKGICIEGDSGFIETRRWKKIDLS